MIFYTLIAFILSLIVEVLLFNFLSPININGEIIYFNVIIFSINSGIVFGSLYSIILFFSYWLIKAYDEIIYKSFFRRAIWAGLIVAIGVFLKITNFFDWILFGGICIVLICLEIIFSQKD